MKLQNILYLFLVAFGLWLLLTGFVYLAQGRIIFQKVPLPNTHVFEFDFPFEEFELLSSDSVAINALYFPTSLPRKGAILYFHGNADNLQRWGQYSEDLIRRGYDVLMIDYRGYGKSEGAPDEAAYYRDARMAYDWLHQKFPADQIVLYGRSLGAAIASQLASTVDARLLILETPFDNIQHAIETSVPVLWLPWPLKYHFANDRYLPKITYPVYIFHGTSDRVVSYRSAEALKPLLTLKDQFCTIEGGEHKNLGSFPQFQEALDKVLQ